MFNDTIEIFVLVFCYHAYRLWCHELHRNFARTIFQKPERDIPVF
jgi:hypothetical protein